MLEINSEVEYDFFYSTLQYYLGYYYDIGSVVESPQATLTVDKKLNTDKIKKQYKECYVNIKAENNITAVAVKFTKWNYWTILVMCKENDLVLYTLGPNIKNMPYEELLAATSEFLFEDKDEFEFVSYFSTYMREYEKQVDSIIANADKMYAFLKESNRSYYLDYNEELFSKLKDSHISSTSFIYYTINVNKIHNGVQLVCSCNISPQLSVNILLYGGCVIMTTTCNDISYNIAYCIYYLISHSFMLNSESIEYRSVMEVIKWYTALPILKLMNTSIYNLKRFLYKTIRVNQDRVSKSMIREIHLQLLSLVDNLLEEDDKFAVENACSYLEEM